MGVRVKGIRETDGSSTEVIVDGQESGGGSGSVLKKIGVEVSQSQLRALKSNPIVLLPNAPNPMILPVTMQYMFYPKPTNPTAPQLQIYLNVGIPVPGGMQGSPGLSVFASRLTTNTRNCWGVSLPLNGLVEFVNMATLQPLTSFGLAIWADKDAPIVEGSISFEVEYAEYPITP